MKPVMSNWGGTGGGGNSGPGGNTLAPPLAATALPLPKTMSDKEAYPEPEKTALEVQNIH